ncbi:MAG TPA: hypothetical protein VFF06_33925 [Polyangia bacterium]|nr:hypothetical protein [Polyangia bacterium]
MKTDSLSGPRVAEVISAAGDVRDALPLDGAVWLATSGGILRASSELAEEARFTTLDGLPSNDVWALASENGALFAATSAGVVRARVENGRLAAIETLGLPRARALALVDGVLYAGSWGGGLARLDGGKLEGLAFGGSAQVTRMRADGERLWVATAGMGILRVDLCAARGCTPKTRWFTRRDGLTDDVVWDLLPSGAGALVATIGGLAAIDGDRATTPAAREQTRGDLRALGLVDGRVVIGRHGEGLARDGAPLAGEIKRARAIVAFGRGAIVCGEDGAALVWPDGTQRASLHPLGLPSPDVTALALDGDTLYAGTFDRGVVRVRRAGGSLELARVDGVIDERVNALGARTGELWIGTARGATRIRGAAITNFTAADGLPDDHVNAILVERDAVWLATTRGLARIDDAGVRKITAESGLPATRLSSLARGPDGALWVGTAHGVARLAGGDWTLARAHTGALPDDFVTALAADGSGALWAGTYSSGVARRDLSGAWSITRERDGLPSNWVNPGALASWSGRLFVGSNDRGLGVLGAAWTTLDVAAGLPSADVTSFAASDGELWVGTRGGLARVVMSKLEARR